MSTSSDSIQPNRSQDPSRSKKTNAPSDSGKFKKMVTVEKKGEIDPEEQKKKKRPVEEELAAQSKKTPKGKEDVKTIQKNPNLSMKGKAQATERGMPVKKTDSPKHLDEELHPVEEKNVGHVHTKAATQKSAKDKTHVAQGKQSTHNNTAKEAHHAPQKSPLHPTSGDQAVSKEESVKEEIQDETKVKNVEQQKAQEIVQQQRLEKERAEKKIEEKQVEQTVTAQTTALQAADTPITAPPTAPPPYAQMSSQVSELFEKMAGVMMVMDKSDRKETSIRLNNPNLKGSKFYNVEIKIVEFKSAPRIYNVELKGGNEAITAFQKETGRLEQAFKTGNYNFKVHNIQTSLAPIGEEE